MKKGTGMTKNKLKQIYTVSGVILMTTFAFVLTGQGCGQGMMAINQSSLVGGQCSGSGKVIDKNYPIVPGRPTVSISYGDQLLSNYVSCAGIGQASLRTRDEFNARKQSLSEYGLLTDVSAATMMAMAAVAAEVCQDLVDRERPLAMGARNIFTNVDLSGNGLTRADVENTTRLLALACWQRNAKPEEISTAYEDISQLQVNSALGAVSLCTSILGSLSAVEQ
jgi:hypothetical protein